LGESARPAQAGPAHRRVLTSSVATKLPVRFAAHVTADRVIKLPDDVPLGPAEIVVLPPGPAKTPADRLRMVRELQRTSPPQVTDSTDLLRADRDGR
jgi:hypothetical protein